MLRHPEGSRILLLRGGGAFALPRAQAANAWVGNARAIVPAFERRLGAKPWLLRQLRLDKDESRRRTEMVLEFELLDPRWQPPRHGRWVDRSDLARVRLANEDHASLLDDYLDALERNDVPKARAPWARPGWHGEVWDWVQATTATLGHRPLALEQVKHWSIS